MKKAGLNGFRFEGAWVSHAEEDGESDLVVRFGNGKSSVVLLIENKIAANFQPDQVERYFQRAKRWAASPQIQQVLPLLVAPESYMHSNGAERFGVHITYEDLAEAVGCHEDGRTKFFVESLLLGAELARKGYVPNPDEGVSSTWGKIYELACAYSKDLRMEPPAAKPKKSSWIYFRNAVGFEGVPWRTAVIVYKAERGFADLQFGGTSADALRDTLQGNVPPSFSIEKASKSASVRIEVPKINLSDPGLDWEGDIIEGLAACELLRQFFVQIRDLLPIMK